MDVSGNASNGKRLIDANALISYIDECSQESRFRVYYGYAKSFINNAPTVDAVPVVRCRDCFYYTPVNDKIGKCVFLIGEHQYVVHDGYCYLGERKEGAD